MFACWRLSVVWGNVSVAQSWKGGGTHTLTGSVSPRSILNGTRRPSFPGDPSVSLSFHFVMHTLFRAQQIIKEMTYYESCLMSWGLHTGNNRYGSHFSCAHLMAVSCQRYPLPLPSLLLLRLGATAAGQCRDQVFFFFLFFSFSPASLIAALNPSKSCRIFRPLIISVRYGYYHYYYYYYVLYMYIYRWGHQSE